MISRIGRRRRERRAPTQPDHPFAIEACELLLDGAFALLRVGGSGTVAPVSLVTQGDGPQAFDPLPQPGAGAANGVWRIAFALPADAVEPGTRVWLHDGGLYLADLLIPAPAEPVEASKPPATEVTPEADDAAERLAAVEERIAAAHEEAAVRQEEDANVGDDARAKKLVDAWSEAATLREKLADREEELAEALKELLAARKHVQPLRDRAEEPAALEPRVAEAERAREAAEHEVASLRTQVEQLKQALSTARAEAQSGASSAEELRSKLTKLEGKPRRSGIGRRADDRAAKKARTELESRRAEFEAKLAERERRIEQLEKDAEGFAARADDAVADSLRERIGELEEDVRQSTACNDDLRALLDTERQMVAAGRRELEDLKKQLAVVGPERVAEQAEPARPAPKPLVAPASSNGVKPPPWSALDDELLARIEKAKALTR